MIFLAYSLGLRFWGLGLGFVVVLCSLLPPGPENGETLSRVLEKLSPVFREEASPSLAWTQRRQSGTWQPPSARLRSRS